MDERNDGLLPADGFNNFDDAFIISARDYSFCDDVYYYNCFKSEPFNGSDLMIVSAQLEGLDRIRAA